MFYPIPFRWFVRGRLWKAWKCKRTREYFLECDQGALTGPFSSPQAAFDWAVEIRSV